MKWSETGRDHLDVSNKSEDFHLLCEMFCDVLNTTHERLTDSDSVTDCSMENQMDT